MKSALSEPSKKTTGENLNFVVKQWAQWVENHFPPGIRSLVGLVLCAGGVFGILPILGFWMIPLGIAVIAVDIKPLFKTRGRKKRKRSQHRENKRIK